MFKFFAALWVSQVYSVISSLGVEGGQNPAKLIEQLQVLLVLVEEAQVHKDESRLFLVELTLLQSEHEQLYYEVLVTLFVKETQLQDYCFTTSG